MNGFVDQFLHILRQTRFEAQPVACHGMDETQHGSVKRLAVKIEGFQDRSQAGVGASIDRISH